MADLATLGTRFITEGAEASERAMDGVANAADRVEKASDGAAAATKRAGAAMAGASSGAKQFATATERMAAEQEAAIKTAQRLNAVHGTNIVSTKAMQQATLGLGRQFADVGTQLASGQSPFLILAQQGPQVVDIFAQLKTQGVGTKQVLTQMATAALDVAKKFAPLLATGAILGGVALAAYGVWKEIQKTKQAMKDLESATLAATAAVANAREAMKEASLGAGKFGENSLGAAFGIKKFAGEVGDAAIKLYDFAAASKAATVNGLMAQRAMLATKMEALEARGEAGRRSALTGPWTPARVAGKLGNRIGGDLLSLWTGGESDKQITTDIGKARDAMKELEKAIVDVGNQDLKGWADEGRAALGDLSTGGKKAAQAIKASAVEVVSLADGILGFRSALAGEIETMGMSSEALKRREIELKAQIAPTQELADNIRALGAQWEANTQLAKEWTDVQAQVKAAANDNIKAFNELGVRIPSALENAAFEMDEAARAARDLRFDIEDIAYAINNSDWTSAFAGLVNVLAKVETAFKTATSAKDKYTAVAQLAQGVGSAVGGKGGAVIGGAGSGALAGLSAASALTTLGIATGPIGWAAMGVGALLGGLGGLFGGSSAKKRARQEEEARRQAEEAQRLLDVANTKRQIEVDMLRLQGKETEAVAIERQAELDALAKLDAALVEQKKAYYAAFDAAEAKAKADAKAAEVAQRAASIQEEIDKLTMSDADLLAKTRAKERAEAVALDPTLGDLIDKLFGLQDAATAAADATAKAAADQEAWAKAFNDNIAQSMRESEEQASRAAAAQAQVADVMGSLAAASDNVSATLKDTVRSLTDFADSLKAELGIGTSGGALGQAEKAFKAAVASANYAAIPTLGRAYADAVREEGSEADYRRALAQIQLASLNSVTSAKSDAYQRDLSLGLMGAWITGNDARAAEIMRLKAQGLPGFAAGGAMTIAGVGGVDQNIVSVNDVPVARVNTGETMAFIPRGANDNGNAALTAAVMALGAKLDTVIANTGAAARSAGRLYDGLEEMTEGFEFMPTEAESA